MKKTFLLASLITSTLLALSCQKSASFKTTTWQKGQPEASLKELNSISTTPAKFQIVYKNQKIQHFEQSFDSETVVAGTMVKKIYDAGSNSEISFAEATYVDKNLLPKKLDQHIDSAKILVMLGKLVSPNTIKSYNIQSSLELQNQSLKPITIATYELQNGLQWQAKIDEKYEILSVGRVGSRLATDTMASVYTVGPKLSLLTTVMIQNLERDPTISSRNIFVDSESPNKINNVTADLKFDPKDERFDQVQVYYYLSSIQDWMKKNLDIQFVDRLDAVVNVGYPEKTNTAFYYQNKIRLGRGDEENYASLASDPSIVYHEAFHALIDGLAHLPYENEGGSLNEAFADFFTCVALGRPYLAESAYLKGPYKRTLELNRKLDEKNGGLYYDSLIVSGLLWEVKEKIGQKKALNLATETLVKLNHYSEFNDFNKEFLAAAQKNLAAEDLQNVLNILKKRGFKHE